MPTDPTPERTLLSLTQQVTGFARLNTARGTPVHRAATELLARVEAMGWQPIESAPKPGGEDVLVCEGEGGAMRVAHRAAWMGDPEAWACDGEYLEWRPTHWMPLPPPPVVPTVEQGGSDER